MKTKLLILALFNLGLAQSQNLIQNGSFENFTGNVPNSWAITTGTTLKETTTFNHGSSCIDAIPVSAMPYLPTILISQDFTLSDTETYTLKFDYFIPGNSLTNYISGVTYELILNNSSEAFFFPPNYTPATITYGTWKTITFDFKLLQLKAPATSASLKLNLRAGLDVDLPDHHVYFDNVIITKKATLSTVDFTKKSNPIVSISKEIITLNSDYKNSSYVIYSIDGKSVKRVNKNSSENIEISGLATGVYFLKLEDISTSVKFIKQ